MIRDEDVAKYIEYLVENDQVKLFCLMEFVKNLVRLHDAEQRYKEAMMSIMYGDRE
jgi:hypothetical protein